MAVYKTPTESRAVLDVYTRAQVDGMVAGRDAASVSAASAANSAQNSQTAALATGAPIYAAIPGSFAGVASPFIVINASGTALYTHNGTTATFAGWVSEPGLIDTAGLAALAANQRSNGAVRLVSSGIPGKAAQAYRYVAASTEFGNGETVIRPTDIGVGLSTPGRWIASNARVRVMLAWGQSNMQQNGPRDIIRNHGSALFPTTPPHDNFSTVDNGDGTFTQTFNGRGSGGVFYYRTTAADIRPLDVGVEPFADGFNNTAIGIACAHFDRTGESVVIVNVSQGGQPIERFLDTSTNAISGITNASTAVVSVADLRFLPQSVGLPVRFSSVGGMTELNTGSYVARNPSPAWTTFRSALAPVSGTLEIFQSDGVTPVNSTGFGTYTSGGAVLMHHLLDQMDVAVENALTLLGVDALDFIVGFQGEANGPALPTDATSTTGGAATFQTYLEKRRDFIRLMRSRGWADENTRFLDFELARVSQNSPEKPRNDVIGILPNINAGLSNVSSAGYEAADQTHIDDHWGHGYYAGGAALAAIENAGQSSIAVPFFARSILRSDGTAGFRSNVVLMDEDELDISALIGTERRGFLLNTCFTMRSSKLILPALGLAEYDLGAGFQILQWSITGTTPGEADGLCRIECAGVNFTDARTDTVTAGSVTLSSGDLRKPLWFQFLRSANIYFR